MVVRAGIRLARATQPAREPVGLAGPAISLHRTPRPLRRRLTRLGPDGDMAGSGGGHGCDSATADQRRHDYRADAWRRAGLLGSTPREHERAGCGFKKDFLGLFIMEK